MLPTRPVLSPTSELRVSVTTLPVTALRTWLMSAFVAVGGGLGAGMAGGVGGARGGEGEAGGEGGAAGAVCRRRPERS